MGKLTVWLYFSVNLHNRIATHLKVQSPSHEAFLTLPPNSHSPLLKKPILPNTSFPKTEFPHYSTEWNSEIGSACFRILQVGERARFVYLLPWRPKTPVAASSKQSLECYYITKLCWHRFTGMTLRLHNSLCMSILFLVRYTIPQTRSLNQKWSTWSGEREVEGDGEDEEVGDETEEVFEGERLRGVGSEVVIGERVHGCLFLMIWIYWDSKRL